MSGSPLRSTQRCACSMQSSAHSTQNIAHRREARGARNACIRTRAHEHPTPIEIPPRTSPRPVGTEAAHTATPQRAHRAAQCARSTAFTHGSRARGGGCLGGLDRCRVSGATSRRVTASPPCAMYTNGRQRLAAMKQGGRWRRRGAVGRWAAARAATAMHERHGSAMKKACECTPKTLSEGPKDRFRHLSKS